MHACLQGYYHIFTQMSAFLHVQHLQLKSTVYINLEILDGCIRCECMYANQFLQMKHLQEELEERQNEAQGFRRALRVEERKNMLQRAQMEKLRDELLDKASQERRVIDYHSQNYHMTPAAAKKLTALHSYVMHHEESWGMVCQANSNYLEADPHKKLAIYGTTDVFFSGSNLSSPILPDPRGPFSACLCFAS